MEGLTVSLKEYTRKRNFEVTAEPPAKVPARKGHRFVIQKHAATRLHYDFRLEMDGTLKSWAVPKGVPYAKGEKRLAVQVEDHPVSYIDFEGTIPKGQYGGGTVMVWDKGTFEALSKHPAKELNGGKLHFVLHGQKLNGEWYLVRLHDQKQWLLIKGSEGMRPVSKKMDDTSAASGKSMKQLGESDRVWQSRETTTKPKRFLQRLRATRPAKAPPPQFVEPMKARLMDAPPKGDWVYEIKFDGYRALAFINGGDVHLLSRNEKDFAERFPEVRDALEDLALSDTIIDGEIVAMDSKGRSSFQLLQTSDMVPERPPIFYYAFDLLKLNGKDLRQRPLMERKAMLEKTLSKAQGIVRFSAGVGNNAQKLLKQARKLGLEGLIGKQQDSTYESGRRSGAWIKLKLHQEQEFVIGGYTNPEGSRLHFGALLVGIYAKGKLNFCGKVGTGFNQTLLRDLHRQFKQLAAEKCPFANLPEKRPGRYGQGITPTVMKRCHWVRPELVCQIKFGEWTRDEKLRQPVFLGLREDKSAKDVNHERPVKA